ncbi:MAG TPA: hypothetical protein VGN00_24200 [Puia sp.]|jgi:hypothetical protein
MTLELDYLENSNWYKEEITDPYQVIAEFFSAADMKGHRKIIKDLLFAANSKKIYSKDSPGDLLFHMKLFESLINSAHLINQEKKKSPLEISDYDVFNPNLFRGWDSDSNDWDFLPRSLSLKEYRDPYVVFKRFFKFMDLASWKRDLQEVLDFALVKDFLFEAGVFIDCLSIYLHLTKLIEAAHLIDVRETYHIGGMMKNRLKERQRH